MVRNPETHAPAEASVLDILSIVIGLVVGALAVAVVIETTGRSREKPSPQAKLTTGWRLREFGRPVIVARDVLDVDVPDGSTVFASGLVDPKLQATCTVKQVPPVRAEFALDQENGRALLFTAGATEGSLALVTVDPATVQRLETEFRSLRGRSDDYVERRRIAELAGRHGVTVEVDGVVQDVLPFHDEWMIRLEDQGAIIGVVVKKDASELQDERIRVTGRLDKDRTGYAVITADAIRRIR